MKNLFLIGGTMGVGKTTTCRIFEQKLNNSVFLDGDWCWNMHPFQVTEETKRMVVENICFLLNNFIRCSAYENIVFCWVMHQQEIIDDILSRLETENCKIHTISLVCGEQALRTRLRKDVNAEIREEDVIQRSIERLPLYDKLDTAKIDVSEIGPEEAADLILSINQRGESQHG
jgi:broad-specificity NMP kinase